MIYTISHNKVNTQCLNEYSNSLREVKSSRQKNNLSNLIKDGLKILILAKTCEKTLDYISKNSKSQLITSSTCPHSANDREQIFVPNLLSIVRRLRGFEGSKSSRRRSLRTISRRFFESALYRSQTAERTVGIGFNRLRQSANDLPQNLRISSLSFADCGGTKNPTKSNLFLVSHSRINNITSKATEHRAAIMDKQLKPADLFSGILLFSREDLAFINLRSILSSLLKALHVCLFATLNNKRIIFVGDPQPLVQEHHQRLLSCFIGSQIKAFTTKMTEFLPPLPPSLAKSKEEVSAVCQGREHPQSANDREHLFGKNLDNYRPFGPVRSADAFLLRTGGGRPEGMYFPPARAKIFQPGSGGGSAVFSAELCMGPMISKYSPTGPPVPNKEEIQSDHKSATLQLRTVVNGKKKSLLTGVCGTEGVYISQVRDTFPSVQKTFGTRSQSGNAREQIFVPKASGPKPQLFSNLRALVKFEAKLQSLPQGSKSGAAFLPESLNLKKNQEPSVQKSALYRSQTAAIISPSLLIGSNQGSKKQRLHDILRRKVEKTALKTTLTFRLKLENHSTLHNDKSAVQTQQQKSAPCRWQTAGPQSKQKPKLPPHDVNESNQTSHDYFFYTGMAKLVSKAAIRNSQWTASLAQPSNYWIGGFFSNNLATYKQKLSYTTLLNIKMDPESLLQDFQDKYIPTENRSLLRNTGPQPSVQKSALYRSQTAENLFSASTYSQHLLHSVGDSSACGLWNAIYTPVPRKSLVGNLEVMSDNSFQRKRLLKSFRGQVPIKIAFNLLNIPPRGKNSPRSVLPYIRTGKFHEKVISHCLHSIEVNKATNAWLKEADLVFFANPEKTLSLLNQINRLKIPTLGIINSGSNLAFPFRSVKGSSLLASKPTINYPIIGNSNSLNFLRIVLTKFACVLNKRRT